MHVRVLIIVTSLLLSTLCQFSSATEFIGSLDKNGAFSDSFKAKYRKYLNMDTKSLAEASVGNVDAKLVYALRFKKTLKEDERQKYFLLLEQAAKANNPDAENQLGLHYWRGEFVDKDAGKASKFFVESLNHGGLLASYNLAVLQLELGGDPVESIELMEQASAGGIDLADYWLGTLFLYGEHIPPDFPLAIAYLEEAAKSYQPARTRLGEALVISAKGEETVVIKNGLGLLKDESLNGDHEASEVLGRIYSGIRIEEYHMAPDIIKARQYYQLARRQGSPTAVVGLINLELEVATTEGEIAQAISIGNTASDHEAPWAWAALGYLYAKGDFVEKNDSIAVQFFRKSAGVGNPSAMFNLALMLIKDPELKLSDSEATDWLNKSASLGHVGAAQKLKDQADSGI